MTVTSLHNQEQIFSFLSNVSFLGRCYDILTLDPLNASRTAKSCVAFAFRKDEGDPIPGEAKKLKPRGTRFTPGAGGSLSDRTQTSLLYTASDVQALFQNSLGSLVLKTLGNFLPFSHSANYNKIKREVQQERRLSAFTQAEFIDYSLELNLESPENLHISDELKQAIEQLPEVSDQVACQGFIEKFGTHVSTHVKFGGLAYRQLSFDFSAYSSVASSKVDVQAELSKLMLADLNLGVNVDSVHASVRENVKSSSQYQYSGGTPNTDLNTWFASIREDPAPVEMVLLPIYELLTETFFPDDAAIVQKQEYLRQAITTYLEQNSDRPTWEIFGSRFSVGGTGGSEFADLDLSLGLDAQQGRYGPLRVSAVNVRVGRWIDQVQMVWTNGHSDPHGGNGSGQDSFALEPDDYIMAVVVTKTTPRIVFNRVIVPECLASIEVKTKKGAHKLFGRPNGEPITLPVPKNFQVVGFHGRSGRFVDRLGILAIPVPV